MATANTITEDDDTLQGGDTAAEELVVTEQKPEEDARPGAAFEHDAEDAAAEASATSDAEREAIRERRRKEKLERKERREAAINRDKLELDFLRKRNDDLERRFVNVEQRFHRDDLSRIDTSLRDAVTEVEMAEKVIAKAVAAGNGEDVAQAMRYRDQAIAKAQQLNQLKQQAAQRPAPQAQNQPQAPQMDEAVLDHAKDFLEDHPWYDLKGGNEESAIVLAIDQSLAREGFSPNSDEYWDELRRRVARRLPDKAGKQADAPAQRQPRGGPAVGSGREHAPTSTRREVYISPERKQALIDAGVWDDPVLRMKYVKRYAAYDKENRA